ncbi:hypothetical protein PWJ72_07685 [Serratia nevei]|nr:hypothetical protein [Serratia nevei]
MENHLSENGASHRHERAIEQTLADMNSVLLESDLFMTRLTVQDRRRQKRIAIEILRQHHRWEMANPRPPEELPEWEAIGPFRKSKRHLIERTND